MTTLCLHHNDADGRASAAIVRRYYGPDTLCHEMNYGDPVPWDLVAQADRVVVVDFSLPLEEMIRLAEGRAFIWIDHHKSSLETLGPEAERRGWPGLRSAAEAACVLTWRYFFPDQPVPRAVVLIGDRDIWRWAEADTGPFTEGLYHEPDTSPCNDALWEPLLNDDPATLRRLVERGKVLRAARLQDLRRAVDRRAFPVRFEGHRTLAINHPGSGDLGAIIRGLGYTIAYTYVDGVQNGELRTFVTLYSDQVDVSEIARKFGGGGHPGAAGFSFPRGAAPFPSGSRWELLPPEEASAP